MILVTGALGFIGSHLLDRLLMTGKAGPQDIIALDNLSYAANIQYLNAGVKAVFAPIDLANLEQVELLFGRYRIRTIYHLAAETHVDNSIKSVDPFIQSNIMGTLNLLKMAEKYPVERFVHVSTDEVYGHVAEGSTNESTPYHTRNPYSATKAASDHLVTAWHHTYGIPTMITHCSNNYGPRQHGEKMIPTIIHSLMNNQPVPVYGDGLQIRDWLYVQDHCDALVTVAERGKLGEVYNIGAGHEHEITNIDLVKMICDIMDKPYSLIEHVEDRKGHDRRYSIDSTKIRTELGWHDSHTLEQGLSSTIQAEIRA
jgi:dTDP-glucose 4,6-dehydratase